MLLNRDRIGEISIAFSQGGLFLETFLATKIPCQFKLLSKSQLFLDKDLLHTRYKDFFVKAHSKLFVKAQSNYHKYLCNNYNQPQRNYKPRSLEML